MSTRNWFIALGGMMLLSACQTPQHLDVVRKFQPLLREEQDKYSPIAVEPARSGEILVFVGGGPVKNQGAHWFPEGSTLATVLDWAGLDETAPPRTVRIVDPQGNTVRCRVAGRSRSELEEVKVSHGTRIMVPWDRSFGGGPKPRSALDCSMTRRLHSENQWLTASEADRRVNES